MFDQTSEADTLKRCKEAITANRGVDEFTLRIFRRKSRADENRGGMWANLCQARLEHIQMPELWMPMLLGAKNGGFFTIQVWHGSDPNAQLGAIYFEQVGLEADAQISVMKSPDWHGPLQALYPRAPSPVVEQGTRIEPSRYAGEAAPSAAQVRASVAVGGDTTAQGQQVVAMAAELERERRQLAQERADLALRTAKDEADRRQAEADRRQQDLERRLQESTQKFEALSRKIDELKSAPAVVATPQHDLLDTLIRAKDLIMPVVAQFTEVRKVEAQAQREQTTSLLKAVSDNAALATANMEKVLAKLAERENGPSIKPQMEALGSMASMAVSMMHTAQSMVPKTEEPSIAMIIAEKAMPVFEQFGKAMLENAEARKIEAQNLPRDAQAQRIPPPPNRPAAAPKPAAPPAAPPPEAEQVLASNSIGTLIAMVKREESPEKVGAYFFDVAALTPEMNEALNKNGRDIGKTIAELALAHKRYLTSWWLKDPKHAEDYLSQVEAAILEVGRKRGHVNDDDLRGAEADEVVETTATPAPAPNGVTPIPLVERDDAEASSA